MSKPFAVFDIDGTVFRSSLLIELVETLIEVGIFPQSVSNQIEPELNNWRDRTSPDAYKSYINNVVKIFLDNLPSVNRQQLENAASSMLSEKSKHTYIFTRDLIEKLKNTHVLFAISGSPEPLVERFAKQYGFTDYFASKLLMENGVYIGEVESGDTAKDKILDNLVNKHGLDYSGSIAVGDTSTDVDLLKAVEKPIAFNPDKELRRHAQANNWRIVIERKSEIYSLEPKDGTYTLA